MTRGTSARTRAPDGSPRIASLDVLRGLAILGILFMNINDMGGSLTASTVIPSHIGWTGIDRVTWWLREVFGTGAARCMLEMLFGVGMVILTDRAAEAADGRAVMRRYYVRNLVLVLFGLIHIFILLWPGDILHTYGIAALIAFLFRRLPPRLMLTIGLIAATSQLFIAGYDALQTHAGFAAHARQQAGAPLDAAGRAAASRFAKGRRHHALTLAETTARVAVEDRARSAASGSFGSWAKSAWGSILDLEAQGFELLWIWEAVSTMLIGAALYRWGVIQGARSRRFYALLAVVGLGFGIACRAIGASDAIRANGDGSIGWPTGEYARLAITLGYIGIVHLALGTALGARLLSPFVAAGRTALSLYIGQSLIGLWLLYPPFALGLYGTQGWLSLMLTAIVINALLLLVANLYLRRFKIGPVEWAWRSLIEWRRLPFRLAGKGDVPSFGQAAAKK